MRINFANRLYLLLLIFILLTTSATRVKADSLAPSALGPLPHMFNGVATLNSLTSMVDITVPPSIPGGGFDLMNALSGHFTYSAQPSGPLGAQCKITGISISGPGFSIPTPAGLMDSGALLLSFDSGVPPNPCIWNSDNALDLTFPFLVSFGNPAFNAFLEGLGLSVPFPSAGELTGRFIPQSVPDAPGFPPIVSGTFFLNGTVFSPLGVTSTLTLQGTAINTPTPEPATLLLFGSGLLGVSARRRRKAWRRGVSRDQVEGGSR